jgi:hypothetical protein
MMMEAITGEDIIVGKEDIEVKVIDVMKMKSTIMIEQVIDIKIIDMKMKVIIMIEEVTTEVKDIHGLKMKVILVAEVEEGQGGLLD